MFLLQLDCFYLNQSSVTFHLSLPHPCVCFWSFLILSLIYYRVFSLKSYSCDMKKCASQTQFFFSFLYPLYSSLWWCQWALASAGRLSTLPSLSCESRLAGGLEDGWRCVRRAILLNKRGGVRTVDRNTRIKLVSICPFSHHRSFHFPPLCAYELMLDRSSYPQTLNHILPQQKTKVALDQLERVGQREHVVSCCFSPLPGFQPVLSHPPLIALLISRTDGFMDAKGKKYAPHG